MKNSSSVYPFYLLYGSENYLIEEEVQRLLHRTLPPNERDLNYHLFSGGDHSCQEIVQTAQTIPMFSRYRFVLVQEADQVEEGKMEVLLKYIRDPSPTTCLVLCAQGLGPWGRYRREIEKVGKVIEYSRLKGRALISWIRKRMEEKGKILSDEAVDLFIEVVGDHLHDLENALEKISLFVGEKQTVEPSDMEGIVSEVKMSTVFDLTDAIGQQNLEKALGILEKAMGSKSILFRKEEEASKMDDPIPLLLSMIVRQYRLIWRVKERISQRQEIAEVAKEIRMSLWNVKKLVEQGRNFTESSLREGILKCYHTDLALKRGRGPKELLMEKLVIDLCRPQ